MGIVVLLVVGVAGIVGLVMFPTVMDICNNYTDLHGGTTTALSGTQVGSGSSTLSNAKIGFSEDVDPITDWDGHLNVYPNGNINEPGTRLVGQIDAPAPLTAIVKLLPFAFLFLIIIGIVWATAKGLGGVRQ
jgi:hypothetical protein